MSGVRITHIGGPTVLIELDGWRILTDPTFDAPGRRYPFALGTSSRKTGTPAVTHRDLGSIDVVLLSHDHHADNLDTSGRDLLSRVPLVITTRAGARRLGGGAVGLRDGESAPIRGEGRPLLTVVGTPARHGPPLSRPIVGDVLGFGIARGVESRFAVWMTGDSVLFGGLRSVARRHEVDVALVHLGAVRFPSTGPLRYTMNAREGARLIEELRPRVAIPVHYEGWSHFSEPGAHARSVLSLSADVARRVLWLQPGRPTDLAVLPSHP